MVHRIAPPLCTRAPNMRDAQQKITSFNLRVLRCTKGHGFEYEVSEIQKRGYLQTFAARSQVWYN